VSRYDIHFRLDIPVKRYEETVLDQQYSIPELIGFDFDMSDVTAAHSGRTDNVVVSP
jgi:hypothetical protein